MAKFTAEQGSRKRLCTPVPQMVGFSGVKLGVDAAKFPLHFRVSGHGGKSGIPGVVTARHTHAGLMHEALQQAELSLG